MTTTTTRAGTYQMLWDCPSCGTAKLLGVDHRHCPMCGAPQEENLRYVPSKEDRVATEFRGSEPDWECERCGTPTGSAAGFCGGCGAPRGDSTAVFVRPAISAEQGETGQQAASEWAQRQAELRAARMNAASGESDPALAAWASRFRRVVQRLRARPRRLVWIALGLAMSTLLLFAICDRKVALQVTGHAWTRVIPVERYSTVSESAWCDATPSDARIRSRVSEIHHHDRVPDGEDCNTVPESCSQTCTNVDNGNGSFSEVCSQTCTPARTECTTRYREVPVYADKCYYDVDRWIVVRNAQLDGADLSPVWPAEPEFAGCGATALGCERIGARYGIYRVHYVGEDEGDDGQPERFECERAEAVWAATAVGARFTGEVSRLTGELDCDDLEPL